MILTNQSHEIIRPDSYADIISEVHMFLEKCGRIAYQSEGKMEEGSFEPFLQNLIKRGHESVLEHSNISVIFKTDRGVTHELVRHRLAAFTQESTRYCKYNNHCTFIIPVWFEGIIKSGIYLTKWNIGEKVSDTFPVAGSVTDEIAVWAEAMLRAEKAYKVLLDKGWSPQQTRSVLPNSLKTVIVVTANVREWRHILKMRTSEAAHPQMRALMKPLLKELKELIPILFEDIGRKEKEEKTND